MRTLRTCVMRSLNDLPANKCYKRFTAKPHSPSLIDEQHEHVGGGSEHRVDVTVDPSKVGDLIAPDPVETAEGGLSAGSPRKRR